MDGAPAAGAAAPGIHTEPYLAYLDPKPDAIAARRAPIALVARQAAFVRGPQDEADARRRTSEMTPFVSQISEGMNALQER